LAVDQSFATAKLAKSALFSVAESPIWKEPSTSFTFLYQQKQTYSLGCIDEAVLVVNFQVY
jgi:hypothetical protein